MAAKTKAHLEITRSRTPFEWTTEVANAFDVSNCALCSEPVLNLLFCAIFLTRWKQNFPLKWNIFITPCLPIVFTPYWQFFSRFWMLNFFLTKLNATDLARFLKTFEIWVFFGKIDGFFEKIVERGKFAAERVPNATVSQNVFSAWFLSFFREEIRKHWTLEKQENMMKKQCFF